MTGARREGLFEGTRVLILACFAASLLFAALFDVLAGIAGILAVHDGSTAEQDEAGFALMATLGRPTLSTVAAVVVWVLLVFRARWAARMGEPTRHARMAMLVLLVTPFLAVALGLVLTFIGVFWALDLEST